MFEYDSSKSKLNFVKHGIDFERAQEIWDGPYLEFAARSEFENRFAAIGPVSDKLYTCIFTVRAGKIRIISCRRSREKEVELYEKNISSA